MTRISSIIVFNLKVFGEENLQKVGINLPNFRGM